MMVLLVGAVVVIAAAAAVTAYLAGGGAVTVPFTQPPQVLTFANKEAPQAWRPPAGKIPVPVSARAIKAYTRVSRDDVLDMKAGAIKVAYLDPSAIPDTMIRDVKHVIGRVLARDKGLEYAFTEEDFLPTGTRSGLVAGIPAGMRAVRVPLEKARGLYLLAPGDRFDLVATQELGRDDAADLRKLGGVYGEKLALESTLQTPGRRAAVRVVVQNGSVVMPAQVVEVPVSVSTTRGKGVGSRPVQEVVIAVRPEEVGPLAEAMEVDAELSVVARSGRPDDPKDSVTPDLIPRGPLDQGAAADAGGTGVRLVETIDGANRDIVPVPKSAQEKEPK
jgi:Flp pilus assembly protein CpaB